MADVVKKDAPAQEPESLRAIQVIQSLTPTPAEVTEQDIVAMEKRALMMAKRFDTMRKAALSTTSIADWIDENGKPYLVEGGCKKVGGIYGVSSGRPEYNTVKDRDDIGDKVDIECIAETRWRDRSIFEVGTASSRDPFFGKANGKFLPLSEIDMNDVKKKALTNALNRGLKAIVGLSMTWEEIAEITGGRITQAKVVGTGRGVAYGSGSQGGKAKDKTPGETAATREEVWTAILEMAGGDAASATKMLTAWTAFKGRTGDMVLGKTKIGDVSEMALKILAHRVHEEYRKFKGDAGAPPEPGRAA